MTKATATINTGFQFKASMRDLDKKLTKLRFDVKVANAVRKAMGNADLISGRSTGQRRYKVEVYYRLGENNTHRDLYSTYWMGHRAFRVKRQHAQYASVYVRDAIDWDVE